jgi:hypothetical protein
MKAVGNWVIIKRLEYGTSTGIQVITMDEGTVLSCVRDSDLEGKVVKFDINKVISKFTDYWVIDYAHIFGVVAEC